MTDLGSCARARHRCYQSSSWLGSEPVPRWLVGILRLALADARGGAQNDRSRQLRLGEARVLSIHVLASFKAFFRHGQHIAFSGDPDIKGGEKEDAHDEGGHQSADDDDGKWALRIGTDGMRHGGGK